MITPKSEDAKHKAWLFRVLAELVDDPYLASVLYFKGGTCAALRDFLDRFSVDLDFDYVGQKADIPKTEKKMEAVFKKLGLTVKDKSKIVPQYFLQYEAKPRERNTLKIDVSFPHPESNRYESVKIVEIDRIVNCQTIETMFANKLLALIGRFEKNGSIAGRDLYDVHHFFMNGFAYDDAVIREMRNQTLAEFLQELLVFIDKEITQTVIDQDINTLVEPKKFQLIRTKIKPEVVGFLRDEIGRVSATK